MAIDCPMNRDEIEGILKCFAKDKNLGPDGQTVEFFMAFFDIVGDEMLATIEQSITEGYVSKAYNATFLTLIQYYCL